MNPNINYIISESAISLIVTKSDGAYVRTVISKQDKRYAQIIEALGSEDYATMSPEDFLELCKKKEVKVEGLTEQNGAYFHNGQLLPEALSIKIKSIKDSGVSFAPFEAFLDRLVKNPSATSIAQLYDFLAYKELPITADGCFMAYKGIATDGYSVRGNTATIVTEGTVDDRGRIKNDQFGIRISVNRNQVDDNRNLGCSFGLHVGSYDYASGWGDKTILVKVDPADVVSVPSDCRFQKCRVCAYIPMANIERKNSEIKAPTVTEDLEEIESEYSEAEQRRIDYIEALDNYLLSVEASAPNSVITMQSVIDIIGGTKLALKDALNYIGYGWEGNQIYIW